MGFSRKRRALGQGREEGAQPRTNLYDEVTRKIISELEAGRFPWVQPWSSSAAGGPGLPRNALTGRRYSGVNVLLLWGAAIEGGKPNASSGLSRAMSGQRSTPPPRGEEADCSRH